LEREDDLRFLRLGDFKDLKEYLNIGDYRHQMKAWLREDKKKSFLFIVKIDHLIVGFVYIHREPVEGVDFPVWNLKAIEVVEDYRKKELKLGTWLVYLSGGKLALFLRKKFVMIAPIVGDKSEPFFRRLGFKHKKEYDKLGEFTREGAGDGFMGHHIDDWEKVKNKIEQNLGIESGDVKIEN